MRYALPRSVTPALSQEQVDAQPKEHTSFCPVCPKGYGRVQDRDRHLESYLPHSTYCPLRDCPWTGRRRSDLITHWKKKHSEKGQVLGKKIYKIYDPKPFVKLIINGSSVDEVAGYAMQKATKRLQELGKEDVGANVLGRNLDIPLPFVPSSLLDQHHV